MIEGKVIISAALTGAATKKYQTPGVPYTAKEFTDTVADHGVSVSFLRGCISLMVSRVLSWDCRLFCTDG